MKATTNFNSQVDPIDEDTSVDQTSSPLADVPMPWVQRDRATSDATTLRPNTASSSMALKEKEEDITAAVTSRSRSSSLATAINAPPVDAAEALKPDPGTEADFTVDNNPFAFSPGQLNKLLNPKSLQAFRVLGGLKGIERGVQSNATTGLSIDETYAAHRISFDSAVNDLQKNPDKTLNNSSSKNVGAFCDRNRVYGKNVLPTQKPTPLYKLMWNAYQEKVLIVLTVAAVISLALGLYETFGGEHDPDEPTPVDWVEGLAICVAIIVVVIVGGLNDYQKERAFAKLNAKKQDREIKVLRSGKSVMINVADLLVGDVVHLEPGDIIPVDGIFIGGHDVKCDESSATGESDALKKTGGEQVMRMLEAGTTKTKDLDPFIISGGKVLEGVGTFMATSVGTNSSFGKIMMSIRTEVEPTPLQTKLAGLAIRLSQWAISAASFLFFVLLFRFLANLGSDDRSPAEKASFFMEIFIVAITVIVVAVPEGLPLAVTLALAFATTRLLKENNLVRVLRSCETMGNATTVCSDKTGTLTTNKMTVVAGTFGRSKFAKPGASQPEPGAKASASEWAGDLGQQAKDTIIQSVAINSTAFEGQENGEFAFIGSKTETALLQLARDHLGMQNVAETRANETIIQVIPFDSGKKCMAVVVKLREGGYRVLVKGASEILLEHCTRKVDVTDALSETDLTATDNMNLRSTIELYAKQSLRTIGLVYRDFPQWPPVGIHADENDHVALSSILKDLTFLGVVGIQDPVRPGVPEAVSKATKAGVKVRMVTGDNAVTAKAIATECGIYTDGVVMEGPVFRTLSDQEMTDMLPSLQVLARSSPEDKKILVRKLKSMGETVAVTGDGTNDAPALKAADVGFSMGISGTEVAKEASQIVLMDDNFSSIIVALKWGRAVNDSVQKFLQFQITVSITAVILAFVSAVSHPEMKSVLTAIQLLWVNLFMDTFAGIVLATDPPRDSILNRPPQKKSAALITMNMWKMIIGQTIFQLAITVTLNFAATKMLGYDPDDEHRMAQIDSMIFNTFVWMQIFNEFNCRRLDNGFNIFTGLTKNPYFVCINMVMVGCQIAIMFIGGKVFSVVPMDATQWAISVAVPVLSLPWAIVVRTFPDELFTRIVHVVTWPFVAVYDVLCKIFAPVGRLLSRKKKGVAAVGGPMLVGGASSGSTSGDEEKGRS